MRNEYNEKETRKAKERLRDHQMKGQRESERQVRKTMAPRKEETAMHKGNEWKERKREKTK